MSESTDNQERVCEQLLDSHIATEYVKGQHMKKYRHRILNDVVADRQMWQKAVRGPSFVNGPASGVCIRCAECLECMFAHLCVCAPDADDALSRCWQDVPRSRV